MEDSASNSGKEDGAAAPRLDAPADLHMRFDCQTIGEFLTRYADDVSRGGIFAVPFRGGRPKRVVRLPDGAIVESPPSERLVEAPSRPEAMLPLAAGGEPATIHHANLGLVVDYAPFTGVFLLPCGDVAAVYGAEADPLGVGREATP